jgi:hypothetical protein
LELTLSPPLAGNPRHTLLVPSLYGPPRRRPRCTAELRAHRRRSPPPLGSLLFYTRTYVPTAKGRRKPLADFFLFGLTTASCFPAYRGGVSWVEAASLDFSRPQRGVSSDPLDPSVDQLSALLPDPTLRGASTRWDPRLRRDAAPQEPKLRQRLRATPTRPGLRPNTVIPEPQRRICRF